MDPIWPQCGDEPIQAGNRSGRHVEEQIGGQQLRLDHNRVGVDSPKRPELLQPRTDARLRHRLMSPKAHSRRDLVDAARGRGIGQVLEEIA
jgi:hypothetical protein